MRSLAGYVRPARRMMICANAAADSHSRQFLYPSSVIAVSLSLSPRMVSPEVSYHFVRIRLILLLHSRVAFECCLFRLRCQGLLLSFIALPHRPHIGQTVRLPSWVDTECPFSASTSLSCLPASCNSNSR